ncbi:hypothetical protein ABZX95_17435 [Streptomyces sp. NPDC004232]|uniref:hypothetical protein n=1 Tax=Streptomyces sp. NPDC004232 TaxID=3154454 RepID=UPI00339E6915
MTDTTVHKIYCARGPETVQATSPAPGLYVYEIPANVDVPSPNRWRLGHHSGLAIAESQTESDVVQAAENIADLADWTGDYVDLRNTVNRPELFRRLLSANCAQPTA